MKRISRHLTYANVLSSITAFVVLCGATAFAANQLGKNTVGAKQLKKNAVVTAKIKKEAVTGGKVKKDTLTGTQINEEKLGTVPSAGVANSLTPHEPVHIVGAPGQPSFENGAANIPVAGEIPLLPVGFYKDHEGIVHLQGVAKVGKSVGGVPTVFTLPPGFRPTPGHAAIFEQFTEATAIVFGGSTNIMGLELSGRVLGNEEKPIVLEGITFSAES